MRHERKADEMISEVAFRNFGVLRQTTLPLGPCSLIIGPNGSGKSTALRGLNLVANPTKKTQDEVRCFLAGTNEEVSVSISWSGNLRRVTTRAVWNPGTTGTRGDRKADGSGLSPNELRLTEDYLRGVRIYSLDPSRIAAPARVGSITELGCDGSGLAAVLDNLDDRDRDRFEDLNAALAMWLPEFDRIEFDPLPEGFKAFALRTRDGHRRVSAGDLSYGTLLALTIMTLSYLPQPPSVVCLEEPDRGIHPRLLRFLTDALHRLAYPQELGETRSPVQVIATTHSPYFLQLFREHLEEVVIAERDGLEARFKRLSDLEDVEAILEGADLGEAWYTGVLGGVPIAP